MKYFLILIYGFGLTSCAPKRNKIDYVDGVAVLTSDNFNDFIKANKYVFVKFYAPWCGHCKKLAPGYAKLARKFEGQASGVVLAKVDSTVEGEISEEHEIRGYPTLKFFIDGEVIDYEGSREEQAIEDWIRRQLSIEILVLQTIDDIKSIESLSLAVLLTCPKENTKLINRVKLLAANNPNTKFYISHIDNAQEYFDTNSNINLVVFRDFDDGKKILSASADTDMNTLKNFLDAVKNPLVLKFEDHSEEIFGKSQTTILLFTEDDDNSSIQAFAETAQLKRNDILFAKSKISTGIGQKLAEHLGISQSNNNSVRIIKFQGQEILKYKLDKVTRDSLIKFIDDFKANRVSPYLKSQPVPNNDNHPVKTIVADTFDDLVLKSNKYVFLKVYANWCSHCKQMAPAFEQLGKKLSNVPELMIAEYDGTLNEHPQIRANSFPTLYLYKLRQKKKPIEYMGAKTLQAMIQFLEKELDRDLVFAEDMDSGDDL